MRRYRELLSVAGVPRLTFAVLLSRVTTSMLNLALLVAVSQSYGYALAGLVTMAYAVSNAIVGPARGRLADRREPRRVLLELLAGHVLAYAALVACLAFASPVAILFLVAALLGVTVPPAGPVVRSAWPNLVPGNRLPTAYAFDSAIGNASFVSGPVIAAGLLVALPAAGAVAVIGVLKLAGDGLVALAPAIRRPTLPTPYRGSMLGPLADHRIRRLLAMIVLGTFAAGCLQVTAVVAASGQGSAGVFTGLLAAGALAGGIAYGARRWPGSARAQLVTLHVGTALVLAGAAAAHPAGFGLVLIALAFAAFGLLDGPVETVQQVLVGEISEPRQRIEAFAWVYSVMWAGFGVGTTVAGRLAEAGGTTGPLLVAAVAQLAIAGLAALTVTGFRRPATPRAR